MNDTDTYALARAHVGERVRDARMSERLGRLLSDGRVNPVVPAGDGFDQETLAEYIGLPNPADVLSIDVRANVDVLLTCGGPTVFVRYVFSIDDDGDADFYRAEWHTTDNERGAPVVVPLDDDDAHTLADAYAFGIDALAERAAGPNLG